MCLRRRTMSKSKENWVVFLFESGGSLQYHGCLHSSNVSGPKDLWVLGPPAAASLTFEQVESVLSKGNCWFSLLDFKFGFLCFTGHSYATSQRVRVFNKRVSEAEDRDVDLHVLCPAGFHCERRYDLLCGKIGLVGAFKVEIYKPVDKKTRFVSWDALRPDEWPKNRLGNDAEVLFEATVVRRCPLDYENAFNFLFESVEEEPR